MNRSLNGAERMFLNEHWQIGRVLSPNLRENARIGSALVSLAGGMQKPRSEAEASGDTLFVADGVTNRR